MELKIKLLNPKAMLPEYATAGSAAFDLVSTEDVEGYGRVVVPTGLSFEVPVGYYLSIRSRSGMAFKEKIHAFSGVVDSDYRGEVFVLLLGEHIGQHLQIKRGQRVAQGIIELCTQVKLVIAEELTETERGANGIGSTGS